MEPIFAPDEQVQMVIPCGRMHFDPGTVVRARDRDYLIITNQRLIELKGTWFDNKQGLMSYPRNMVISVDIDNYLLGSTVQVHVQPMGGGPARTLSFPNCGKPEAEMIQKMFTEQTAGRRCPGCGRPLDMQFTFCPFCKTTLKRVCRSCGKPLEDAWANCPYCGA